jgi:hypothetical protein
MILNAIWHKLVCDLPFSMVWGAAREVSARSHWTSEYPHVIVSGFPSQSDSSQEYPAYSPPLVSFPSYLTP